jgi:O-acetyl-ADP-ribose deacetylase (regulator of RNase III)
MSRIALLQGDIAKVEADAIVNAANSSLWMGSGVAGAIKRAGGQQIEAEAVKQGPIPVGEAVVTSVGVLPARYVIHAAVMGPDLRTDAEKISQATKNSLKRAEELGVVSIAIPALGTGVGGFPYDKAAEVMSEVVREHLAQKSGLDQVIFVLYDEEAFRVFQEQLSGGDDAG